MFVPILRRRPVPPHGSSRHPSRLAPLLLGVTGLLLAMVPALEAREIVIRTVPGKMKYLPETFRVDPGESVTLLFLNDDEMQHNLIITRPGTRVLAYAQKAWNLGPRAQELQFVPEDRGTLFHSRVLNPGEQEILTFTAPAETGHYPFVCTLPGHAFSMKGIMTVGSDTPPPATATSETGGPSAGEAHRFHLDPSLEPLIIRASVAGGPSRGISVGFPKGPHLVFNAETCAVEFGWAGLFLDVGPVVGRNPNDRGANPARVLGQRFDIGNLDCPIRIGQPDSPQVTFKGYRRGPHPTFHFEVDGVPVSQTIRPASQGTGFTYTFEVEETRRHVFFLTQAPDLVRNASVGTWYDGLLVVPPGEARRFEVTLTRP